MQFKRTTRAVRRQAGIVGQALTEVRAAAIARPLPADRLERALQGAVAAGAQRAQAAKAAFFGAAESNPADPNDFDHRQQVYDIVQHVVHIVPSWVGGEDA